MLGAAHVLPATKVIALSNRGRGRGFAMPIFDRHRRRVRLVVRWWLIEKLWLWRDVLPLEAGRARLDNLNITYYS